MPMHPRPARSLFSPARAALVLGLVGLLILLAQLTNVPLAYAAVGSDFAQCRNDSPVTGNCSWTGGNLSNSQATYYEGMGTFQRLLFTSIGSGTSHKVDIQYQFSNQNAIKGYDFLVSWAQASTLHQQATGITPTLNQCSGLNPANTTACNQVTGSSGFFLDVSLPDDPYVSAAGDGAVQTRINAFETTYGDRTLRIYSDCPFSGTPTFSISHLTADTADSDVLLTLNYTTRAATGVESAPNCLTGASAGVSNNILLQFAGHLALSGTCSKCWGVNKGAAGISGSGWHIRNIEFDDSGGSMDNQIQISGQSPTAAELISFAARWRSAANTVRLEWVSGTELDVIGYNVWHKRAQGIWHQKNQTLIPAQELGMIGGARYEFSDSGLGRGKMHRYKIQVLRANGTSDWSDVVKVQIPKN